jgi:hypothetical protein
MKSPALTSGYMDRSFFPKLQRKAAKEGLQIHVCRNMMVK